MRRIRLTVAYDGTEFCGWQVQPGLPTIQGELERVFAEIEKRPVHVAGSGRTDAGVHALAQVAAISIANPIPLYNLKKAVNRLLPPAIRITAAEEVDAAFHPRFDARRKTYEYRIVSERSLLPIRSPLRPSPPVSPRRSENDRRGASLRGRTRFLRVRRLRRSRCPRTSKVRTIFCSRLNETGDRLIYRVTGSGFLKHMVRNMVGRAAGSRQRKFHPGGSAKSVHGAGRQSRTYRAGSRTAALSPSSTRTTVRDRMTPQGSLRIVIPGGNGQVGQILARHFHSRGHAVRILAPPRASRSLVDHALGRPPDGQLGERIQWRGSRRQPRRQHCKLPLHEIQPARDQGIPRLAQRS